MSGLSSEHSSQLAQIWDRFRGTNTFYDRKFQDLPRNVRFEELPFTTKAELVADQIQHPPYGSTLLEPLQNYCRLHQTSGTTTGQPLRWLDTPQSWQWMLDCWQTHFQLLGITRADRLFFPFSFGPFLGFWTAFEHASRAGYFLLPGGGQSSTARLKMIVDHGITVLFATPTYAWHLAEVARAEQLPLAKSSVRLIVVAGEPGGAVPSTRQRLEEAWGASVRDHYGLTEVGPTASEPSDNPLSLEVLPNDYIAEVIDPVSHQPVAPGHPGELVLTNLGRLGSPLIRYRTGDVVQLQQACGKVLLVGGIRGRVDDMLHIRGNNVYPSAIEAIIRRFPEVLEYRLTVDRTGPLAELLIELELRDGSTTIPAAVQAAILKELLFRAVVNTVPVGTLPRFEMKARRVHTRQN